MKRAIKFLIFKRGLDLDEPNKQFLKGVKSMAKISGGQLFGKALKKEGVECVFVLSGGHIMPIFYGCREEGIKVIDFRHECAAAYAADAYARVTGKPGIVVTTAGPGITNATTAMAEAAETGMPLIHIGGASPIRENDSGAMQNVASLECMSTFCKWAKKIIHTDRIPEYVSMAFRQALDESPGPVYLEVATDTVHEQVEEDTVYFPRDYRTDAMPFGDPAYIEKAAELLANAKRPVMVLGESARFSSEYGENVEALATYLRMPVFAVTPARGLFADESENELFVLGEAAAVQADVVLELGVDNSHHVGKGRAPKFNKDAKFIQVHADKTMIGYNTPADVGIVAGTGAAAQQLLEAVKAKMGPVTDESWVEEARALTAKAMAPFAEAAVSTIMPIHPGRCAAEVAKFLDTEARDWHVICDGGDAAQWIHYNAKAHYPGQVIKFGKLGTIGAGTGFTTGAWAADKKPVLYYTGDGSFGFYSMEFDTFVRHGVPVVCVISNDSAWGMIKLSQELKFPEYIKEHGHCANQLAYMRAYEKLPEMWGGVGVRVTHYDEIIPAIKKVYESGKPGIVNVQVNEHEMSPRTRSFAGVKK
jgi:acetolactate synthase-1/2/3 large subunit